MVSAEIQRIRDADLATNDLEEKLISEWYAGITQELRGAVRQMRVAAYAKAAGRAYLEDFGKRVKAEKSKLYAYAACYEALHEWYQDQLSERVERSPLTPWQFVYAVKRGVVWGDVEKSLSDAEENNLTVKELTDSPNGKPEEIEGEHCPACGSDSKHWQRVPGGIE